MKVKKFNLTVAIIVFVVMAIYISYKLYEYNLYSKRIQLFCEYLIPGMEMEQVRKILTSNGIHTNERDYNGLQIWRLYSSNPEFERVVGGVSLGFRNNKYNGAVIFHGSEESESLCYSDE